MSIKPELPLTVSVASRAKRIAFLVDLDAISNEELDHTIKFCVRTWGGRFTPIVPASPTSINEPWWSLLLAYDPDIIYSFHTLGDPLIEKLNRYVLPARIIEVTDRFRHGLSATNLIDVYQVGALGVEDIPRYVWAHRDRTVGKTLVWIQCTNVCSPLQRFMLRNFGVLPPTVEMRNAFEGIEYYEVIDLDAKRPAASFGDLVRLGSPVCPIDFNCEGTARPYDLQAGSSLAGCLVLVGDTVLDALIAWNRPLFSYALGGWDSYWIDQSFATPESLRLLGQWIRQNYRTDGHKCGRVMSCSVEMPALRTIADALTSDSGFSFTAEMLDVSQISFPAWTRESRPSALQTQSMSLSDTQGIVSVPSPPFCRSSYPRLGWMVDLRVQYRPERSTWTTRRSQWNLPRKLGVANTFFDKARGCRVVDGGLLSAEVMSPNTILHITVPTDSTIVQTCFHSVYSNTVKARTGRTRRFTSFVVSDKGRSLRGMLSIFGGLQEAGAILQDLFWRDLFERLSGKPGARFERRRIVARDAIQRVLAEVRPATELDDARLDEMASLIAHGLRPRQDRPEWVTRKQLKMHLGQLRARATRHGVHEEFCQDKETFEDFKAGQLQALLDMGAILQGASFRCPRCGIASWYNVEVLRPRLRCPGCLGRFFMSAAPEWSFCLNTLVSTSVSRDGVLALVDALVETSQDTENMFLYLPCIEVYETGCTQAYTDLDVVIIKDGRLVIGEVKSRPGAFSDSDLEKLKAVAIDLVPDEIICAAPGTEWPNEVRDRMRALEASMVAYDVAVSVMQLPSFFVPE